MPLSKLCIEKDYITITATVRQNKPIAVTEATDHILLYLKAIAFCQGML